jgi:peptidoglycan/xylan/chitin deacetylase (PgdA/CDA1 family)
MSRSGAAGTARRAVKISADLADRVRRPPVGVVVLAYHRVGGRTPIDVDLPRAEFAHQMAWLAGTGLVTTLDDAAAELATSGAARHSVVVTFDDGTADFADEALPVLVEHGVPATIYVATRHVDECIPFPDDGTPLSWAALRDAASTGLVTVGSHTHAHRLLDRVDGAEADDELRRSVDLIEEHIGVPAHHFAYPKGLLGSPPAEAVVRRRFVTGAIGGTRPNRPGRTDLHRLARSPIQVSDGRRWFERKVAGGMRLEDDLRRLANRRRYRGAAN